VAEVENRRLIGNGGSAKVNASKTAQRGRIVERIFGTGIGELEPVLQKADAQKDGETGWRPLPALG